MVSELPILHWAGPGLEKFLLVDVRIVERTSLRHVSGSIGRLEGNEEGLRLDPKSLESEPAPPILRNSA